MTNQNSSRSTINDFPNFETWENTEIETRLRVYHTDQPTTIKGIIQINHGLAEHAARYGRFANALAAAGYMVYAHDHRGHGHSVFENADHPDQQQGIFAPKAQRKTDGGWGLVLDDMAFVNQQIRQRHPNTPIILLGHSMGAILSYHYALKWPETIDGLAVWNTAIMTSKDLKTLKTVLKLERLFKADHKPSIVAGLTFGSFNKKLAPNQTSVDWLSKDVEECRIYEADPLCGWAPSNSMWRGLASGLTYGATDLGLEGFAPDLPIHLLAGNDDPSAGYGKPMKNLHHRMQAAGLTNTHCTIRKGGRHEALNEPKAERDAVTNGFIQWLDQQYV